MTPRHAARSAALLALSLLAACAGSRPPPRLNVPVLPPQLSFRAATVSSADFEGVRVDVAFDVQNPNGFALPVVRLEHAVTVDGVPAFSGSAPSRAVVPSGGVAPVTVQVVLPYGRIPAIGERLASGQPIAYAVRGAVGVQTPAGILDLPIAWEGTLPLPRVPELEFEGVDVGASAALLRFDVKLRVTNPNAFAIPGGVLAHRLAVAGAPVASGDQKLPPVAPGATAAVSIPCQVNPFGAGAGAVKAVAAALSGEEIPVALEGRATVAAIPFPVRMEARIPKVRR